MAKRPTREVDRAGLTGGTINGGVDTANGRLSVQGKRVTRTIAAGEIGNDRPLEIVTETWFSPELQVVVMSRTTDPRSGDSVYKLTNVSRAEPDRSLFEVPADYQIREDGHGGPGVNVMRRAPRPE